MPAAAAMSATLLLRSLSKRTSPKLMTRPEIPMETHKQESEENERPILVRHSSVPVVPSVGRRARPSSPYGAWETSSFSSSFLGNPSLPLKRGPWLCGPASRRVCLCRVGRDRPGLAGAHDEPANP